VDDQILKNITNVILEIGKIIEEIDYSKCPPPSKGGISPSSALVVLN
jgi:hypothetical protein